MELNRLPGRDRRLATQGWRPGMRLPPVGGKRWSIRRYCASVSGNPRGHVPPVPATSVPIACLLARWNGTWKGVSAFELCNNLPFSAAAWLVEGCSWAKVWLVQPASLAALKTAKGVWVHSSRAQPSADGRGCKRGPVAGVVDWVERYYWVEWCNQSQVLAPFLRVASLAWQGDGG